MNRMQTYKRTWTPDGYERMEPYEVKVGDVAVLNIGGVPMNIVEIQDYGEANGAYACCRWQDKNGTPHKYAYPLSELFIIDEEHWNYYR